MTALALIAEDDHDIADILRAYLEREGLRTIHAADGRAALDLHLALRPDIMLLDVSMPRVDGWQVLHPAPERDNARHHDYGAGSGYRQIAGPAHRCRRLCGQAVQSGRGGGTGESGLTAQRAALGGGILRVGPLEIDTEAHMALIHGDRGAELALTLTEFRLLAHMAHACQSVHAWRSGRCLSSRFRCAGSDGGQPHQQAAPQLDEAGAPGMPTGVRGVGYGLMAR
jgi:two-component system response regulator AdeR